MHFMITDVKRLSYFFLSAVKMWEVVLAKICDVAKIVGGNLIGICVKKGPRSLYATFIAHLDVA